MHNHGRCAGTSNNDFYDPFNDYRPWQVKEKVLPVHRDIFIVNNALVDNGVAKKVIQAVVTHVVDQRTRVAVQQIVILHPMIRMPVVVVVVMEVLVVLAEMDGFLSAITGGHGGTAFTHMLLQQLIIAQVVLLWVEVAVPVQQIMLSGTPGGGSCQWRCYWRWNGNH